MTEAGLYIHIPFCVRKCQYCAFTSFAARENVIVDYFAALREEIEMWRDKALPKIKTVYFGGGTPSYPDEKYIARTMKLLSEVFRFDLSDHKMEKTIEVNPASAAEKKVRAYAEAGFNRLSVGLQAGQDNLLKKIGRAHTVEDFRETMAAAEKYFDNISVDVMFGLPGQTIENIEETLALITGHEKVKHVSCYSLSIDPGTVFEKEFENGRLSLPSEEIEREMYYFIRDDLAAKGFEQYEISNFAKKGFESKHNSSYWDLTPYIGMGLGASSYYNKERKTNISDLEAYVSGAKIKKIPVEDKHVLDIGEQKGDFMFLGMRRMKGVDDRNYFEKFGSSFYDDYGTEINNLKKNGLIDDDGSRIRLTTKGIDLANQVFMAFV